MRNPEKPHFSASVLDISERTQRIIGHTKLGGALINLTNGSSSPAYRQLDWFSQNITVSVRSSVTVPGNPSAGRLARNWHQAIIMAATRENLDEINEGAGDSKDAVAYISDDIVHVGIRADEEDLFSIINEEEFGLAMRLGRGPLQATMGIWKPENRAFTSVDEIRIVESDISVSALHTQYPGLLLA